MSKKKSQLNQSNKILFDVLTASAGSAVAHASVNVRLMRESVHCLCVTSRTVLTQEEWSINRVNSLHFDAIFLHWVEEKRSKGCAF